MKRVSEIIDILSNSYERIEERCVEDFYSLTLFYTSDTLKDYLPNRLDTVIPARDVLSISIFDSIDDDSEVAFTFCTSSNNWGEFVEEFENVDKSEKRFIKIHISKKTNEDCHSIYDYNLFCSYLKGCQPFSIIGLLATLKNDVPHFFEWQDDALTAFASSEFLFCGKGKRITTSGSIKKMPERVRCTNKAKFLCSSTCIVDNILPEDLFPIIDEDSFLTKYFKKLSTLYTLCFLLDQSHVDNNALQYKLNGFKSVSGQLEFTQNIDDETANMVARIYEWGYQGGDIDDKILIIRNILSLNFDPASFRIHPNTFEAILSNYKIYQKENVRQYLDLRNNIVRDIQKHQDSILHAIDSFEDAFKKISISLLSFFFITVILTILSFVLSSKRFIPDAVLFCCLAISIISLLYYYKERRWLNERILQLEYQFKNSKKYYEDLLGKEELKNFFENENEIGVGNKNFHDKKIKEISNLWKISTWVIVGFLILALLINHFHPLQEIIQLLSRIFNNITSSFGTPAT